MENNNIDTLREELGFEKTGNVNILFLDISSTCTGYAIASVNFEKNSANFTKAGCLWFNDDWSHQEKYLYMFEALQNYFWITERVDYIVVEQYSINPKKMMGVNVVSEMQGAIKAGAWSNGVKVSSILPQSWRSVLKIKKSEKGEYKSSTKSKILELINVPEKVVSNITNSDRKTPSDVYDAVGIGWGWMLKFGINTITGNKTEFNSHVGVLNA